MYSHLFGEQLLIIHENEGESLLASEIIKELLEPYITVSLATLYDTLKINQTTGLIFTFIPHDQQLLQTLIHQAYSSILISYIHETIQYPNLTGNVTLILDKYHSTLELVYKLKNKFITST